MLTLSPDAALLVFTLGIALVYVELNRPGWILPGALGLLAVLLSFAALFRFQLAWQAAVLCLTAIALLTADLVRPTGTWVASAAILALVLGLCHLVIGPRDAHIHISTAVLCGVLLGAATSLLTRIARRARANKAVD
jgi:membrane-bound serine protease (ClpP class)